MTFSPSPKLLNVCLWLAQAPLALLYVGTGIFKLLTPIPELAALWPWAGEQPAWCPSRPPLICSVGSASFCRRCSAFGPS